METNGRAGARQGLILASTLVMVVTTQGCYSAIQKREELPLIKTLAVGDPQSRIPVFSRWRLRPQSTPSFGAWWLNRYGPPYVDASFLKQHKGRVGRVVGTIKRPYPRRGRTPGGTAVYLVVHLKGAGYFFVRQRDWANFRLAKKHEVTDARIRELYGPGLVFGNLRGTALDGMKCFQVHQFDYPWFGKPTADGIFKLFDSQRALSFVGRCPDFFRFRRQVGGNSYGSFVCGTMISKKPVPTRGGFLRMLHSYGTLAIVSSWAGIPVMFRCR